MHPFHRALLLPFVALVAGALVACGGGSDSSSPSSNGSKATPESAEAVPQSVTIADFSFTPNAINSQAAQTIRLDIQNSGAAPHSFTIDGVADSGVLNPGARSTLQFSISQPGTYTYYCTVHGAARMSGRITVGGAAVTPSPAGTTQGGLTPGPTDDHGGNRGGSDDDN